MADLNLIDWPLKSAEKPSIEEIDKLGDALNDVSRRAAAQWLLLLSLWAYLFFTAVAVTDYELLVLPTVKLPFIGVELELFSFFLWGPLLFFIVQLHFARKAALLAATAGRYMDLTAAGETSPRRLENRRHRLDAFAAVGLLCRFDRLGAEKPDWFLRLLTAATVWTTFFLLPAALYGAFFVRFLAYHHDAMTWLHRGLLSAGIVAAWFSVWRVDGFRGDPGRLLGGISASVGVAVVGLSVAVFTFPGEEHPQAAWDDLRAGLPYEWVRLVPEEKSAWVPNVLKPVQPETQFVKLTETGKGAEARRLNLAHRDFSGRSLRGAQLRGMNLQGADLRNVQLQEAELSYAQLRSVDLSYAQLQGANLYGAELQGADLGQAQLQGADLGQAQLQGAYLGHAQLQGAYLGEAHLQGAYLRRAQLQGVNLWQAQLQGVDLSEAHLQVAYLGEAHLQGAYLGESHLHGANLRDARLWRADLSAAEAAIYGISFSFSESRSSETPETYQEEIKTWLSFLPKDFAQRQNVEEWLSRLAVRSNADEDQKQLAETHARLQAASDATTRQQRAKLVADVACRDEHGVHIFRGILTWSRRMSSFSVITVRDEFSPAELSAALSRPDCATLAAALTQEDRRRLEKFVEAEKQSAAAAGSGLR